MCSSLMVPPDMVDGLVVESAKVIKRVDDIVELIFLAYHGAIGPERICCVYAIWAIRQSGIQRILIHEES